MLISLLNNEISEEDYFNMNDVQLIYKELPKKIYGFIFRYKGLNTITINCFISRCKQKRTILHELAHLELSHLDNKKRLLEFKIESIEDEADEYIKFIMEEIWKKYL